LRQVVLHLSKVDKCYMPVMNKWRHYYICLPYSYLQYTCFKDALLSDVLLFLNICWVLLLIQSLDVTITVVEEMAWYLIEYSYSPIIHSCSDLKAHNPVSSSVMHDLGHILALPNSFSKTE